MVHLGKVQLQIMQVLWTKVKPQRERSLRR